MGAVENPEELDLLRAAATGDGPAFDAVVGAYAARLRWLIRLRLDPALRARVSADDVLQDVLVVVSDQIRSLVIDNEGAFWSWLCKVVEQRLVDARRRHLQAAVRDARREQTLAPAATLSGAGQIDAMIAASGVSPSAQLRTEEQRERLAAALDRLPPSYREALVLRVLEGLSIADTASIMGRSHGAVSVLLNKAVRRLAQVMAEMSHPG